MRAVSWLATGGAVLAMGACGCHDGGLDAASARDGSVGAAVELGTGLEAFETVPVRGGELELVHGPQGGWHVYVSVRVRGLVPSELVYDVTRDDGVVLAHVPITVREGTFVSRDEWHERVGDLAIFAIASPDEVVGRDVHASVVVIASDGRRFGAALDARVVDRTP